MRKILAICDGEEEYAHRLMEYLSSKNKNRFRTVAFSRAESLRTFAQENPISLLLVSEEMAAGETEGIRAEKRILMSENRFAEEKERSIVYKYQAAESLVREVMSFYDAENAACGRTVNWRGRRQVIGLYSPVGGTGKTSLALTLGQLYARQVAVLYMNLEGFSGLSGLLDMQFGSGLSDFLYYAAREGVDPVSKLESMTVSVQNLDILPPADSPSDISGIGAAGWVELLNRIMEEGSYEILILDMGAEVQDIAVLADFCSCLYVPVREDPLSEGRMHDFDKYLAAHCGAAEKVRKLKLPFHAAQAAGRDYVENLMYSELGDFARGLIKGNQA